MSVVRARVGRGVLAVVAIVGLLAAPPGAAGQSGLSFTVSPLLGAGSFTRSRRVPADLSGDERIRLDAVAVVGLQGEWAPGRGLFGYRLGVARTLSGRLKAQTGYSISACGQNCTRTEVLYGPVGDAAVTLLWGDAVLDPFRWRASPHFFAGVLYRRDSFSPDTPEIATYYDDPASLLLIRYGIGLDIDVSNGRLITLDFARNGVRASSVRASSGEPLVTLGVKFGVF